MQTDLDELTGDVAGCRLPYHDLQAFLLATLFPDCKNHPILHPVQVGKAIARGGGGGGSLGSETPDKETSTKSSIRMHKKSTIAVCLINDAAYYTDHYRS